MTSPEVIRSLVDPDAYDHPVNEVQLIQTHISWVLLAGGFAYKIKKPVRFGFLDYSTLARRKEMCEREVRLNQRTCPDAYLGVVPIVERNGRIYLHGAGETVEYAVKMRRLSPQGWLSYRVDHGDVSPELSRSVADSVHAFHASAASDAVVARYGSANEVAALWRENLDEIALFAGDILTQDQLRDLAAFGSRFLESNHLLIDERAASGYVRDVHGDLRTDSIYIGADGHICMTDCIEFSDRMRCGDVAGDAAFLAMDLDFRAREDLSDEFCSKYVELSPGDETLTCMLPFYRCYRAAVRGKVESITTREPEIDADQAMEARERAGRYFALAQRYATDAPRKTLIIVGGLSGTGKSHLASALAARIGAALVRSDAVRKEMLRAPDGRSAPFSYDREARAQVYEAARERVRTHLDAGRAVVFDATHLELRQRDAARAAASRSGAPALLIWVSAPEDVVRTRLEFRDVSPDRVSDARWETYLAQQDRMDALTEHERRDFIEVDGSEPVTVNIALIRARL